MKDDKSDELQELVARFEWLDKLFHDQMARDNISSALDTVKQAAKVGQKLQWLMGIQGALVATDRVRDFAAGRIPLQRVIAELDLNVTIWEPDSDGGDRHGWIADSHLNEVLDVIDPDWTERVNERLLEVTVLLTDRPLPEWILRHLRALRRSYALGLNDVAWISLRSLIETASFSRLNEEEDLGKDSNVRSFAEYSLKTCLDLIAKRSWVSDRELKGIRGIVQRTNRLVHAKDAVDVPTGAETLQAINTVVSYLHSLLH